MASVFIFTMRELIKTTQQQFVHKDQLIVYYLTFIVSSMFCKLIIATASQWDFSSIDMIP